MNSTDRDIAQKAREAVIVLRDAVREGKRIDFRERDPLVLAIFAAIDALDPNDERRCGKCGHLAIHSNFGKQPCAHGFCGCVCDFSRPAPETIEERGALATDHRDMEWVLEAPAGHASRPASEAARRAAEKIVARRHKSPSLFKGRTEPQQVTELTSIIEAELTKD